MKEDNTILSQTTTWMYHKKTKNKKKTLNSQEEYISGFDDNTDQLRISALKRG